MFFIAAVLLVPFVIRCVSSQGLNCAFYLSRSLSGVFHYDQRIRYSLTFPAAKVACEQDFGAVVATREQLHAAYLAGLEGCRAGWISSGEVAYPRRHRNWNCGQNRVGIISYGVRKNLLEKWDVYCYKPGDDCFAHNQSLQLEGSTSDSKSMDLLLGSIMPSSQNNASKKQEIAKADLIQLQNQTNQFPNVVKPSFHNKQTKDLHDLETFTSADVALAETSIASSVNVSEKDNFKELVKPFLIENFVKSSDNKYSLQAEQSDKVNAASQLSVNWSKFETTNNLTNGTKKEYYSEMTSSSITTSSEINAVRLQLWNMTIDKPKSSKIDDDSGYKDTKTPQASPLSYKNSPDGRGALSMNTSYQHEITTHSLVSLKKFVMDLRKSNKSDLPFQLGGYFKEGEVDEQYLVNTKGEIFLENVAKDSAVHQSAPDKHLPASQNVLNLDNAALSGVTTTKDNFHPSTRKIEDISYPTGKNQNHQLDLTRGETTFSGTKSSEAMMKHLQISYMVLPQNVDKKTQLVASSQNVTDFPGAFSTSTNVELITFKTQDFSQTAVPSSTQPGNVNIKSNLFVNKNEEESFRSRVNDGIMLHKPVTHNSDSQATVSTERNANVNETSEINTFQPIEPVLTGNSSVLSKITTPFSQLQQSTDSERMELTTSTEERTVQPATFSGVAGISQKNLVYEKESLDKDGLVQTLIHSPGDISQSITSNAKDKIPVSVTTTKSFLPMTRKDGKVQPVVDKDTSILQVVTTIADIFEPSLSLSEKSTMQQNSSEDVHEAITHTFTGVYRGQGVEGTEGAPLPKEEFSQNYASHLTETVTLPSFRRKNVANITEVVTDFLSLVASSISPVTMQTPAAHSPLNLEDMSISAFPVITTKVPTRGGNVHSSTSSFVNPDSCGGVMRQIEGRFQTPHYPQSYPRDMDCTWEIEAPLGYLIRLDFTSLFIEEHRTCKYDYVVVYDGKGPDKVEMGRFCGSELPPQLQGSSNAMSITMRSDSSMELEGFSAQFSTFQAPEGYIHLDRGNNKYGGIIKMMSNGHWGGICAKHWTNRDAMVVCRQLGFGGPALATRVDVNQQNTSQTIPYIKCKGDEMVLQDCDIKRVGKCSSNEHAAVICQVMESCAALKSAGILKSGVFTIDPDGVNGGVDPFPVTCDMISDPATGITIIGHDSEDRIRVSPCEDAGCYSRAIHYNQASLDQLKALTETSKYCKQYISLECRHIRFLKQHWGWWVSRDGRKINSWGGASTDSGKCACGENGNCALGLSTCNCDANDGVWRQDKGYLTDKAILPVREVRFGDTRDAPVEMAFHKISPLHCYGQSSQVSVLESCTALKKAGFQESRRYVIDPDGAGRGVAPFEVFCDLTSDQSTGITIVSHDSERRTRVAPCEDPGCYRKEIKYEAELNQLNALTSISESCEQYVKLDCRHIRFIQAAWGWWTSWDGRRMFYWGGASPESGRCACGMTGSCSVPGKLCNCDSNDHIWRTDEGILRDKSSLPIQAVHFGDTKGAPLEMAFYTIGKLMCKGQAGR
ncbi:uncharacterized protein [Chiloscyllium punctatum]|uniref:uncharacterized protein isoform X2 n=1 Tax=Chiloscyllium punctatum TaxID=137246 RepID=UPI003B632430